MRPGVTPIGKERSSDGVWGSERPGPGRVLILAASPGWARAQAPDVRRRRPRRAPLARYVPREGLAGYLEFDGLDAHEAAWKASAAYKVLNETKLGALFEDVFRQLVARRRHRSKPADLIGAFKMVARQGFAVGVWGKDPEDLHMVAVIRGGGRPEVRRLFEMVTRTGRPVRREDAGEKGRPHDPRSSTRPPGGIEKDDLVVTSQPDTILAVLDGKEPNAIDHPLRTALVEGRGGIPSRCAIGFVDFAGLPKMPPEAVRLGLDGVKRLEFVWGFEGDAMRTVIRAIAPAPRRGVLALFDQPTFDAAVPAADPRRRARLHRAVAGRAEDLRRDPRAAAKMAGPGEGAPDLGAMIEDAVRQQFGFDLRKDLIAGLGPKLTFYMQEPAGAGTQGNRAAAMINRLGGITIAAEVRDAAALSRAIDPVMTVVNGILGQAVARRPAAPASRSTRKRAPGRSTS